MTPADLARVAEAALAIAERFPTEAELVNAVDTFKTWHQVIKVDNVNLDPDPPKLPERPTGNSGENPRGNPGNHDNVMVSEAGGNTQSQALRRLRKDAPELHADVLAGRISAHAAMVKAGFRPKTISVSVTKPEAVARSLLKCMSADDIAKLIAALLRQAA